jgi:type III secretory pathway lipoprotein EscJ
MDNPVVPVPMPPGDGALGRIAAMPAAAKTKLALGTAALAAVLVALSVWSSRVDYKVLYANLNEKDGGAIISQLSQMNIPYRHADGGNAILVPAAQVHDARLKLASAGLPKGSVVGFELMDSARFGQTQFQERLTFQRGLEGELTRSILALGAVQAARVHLALPQQNGFFREQQKPSASVLVTLHPGRALDRAQIAGIVHLVSSSVPELTTKAVSIIDQTGALLSGPSDSAMGSMRSNCSTCSRSSRTTTSAWSKSWSPSSAATTCAPPSPPKSTSRRANRPRSSSSPTRAANPPPCAACRPAKPATVHAACPPACRARRRTSRRQRPPRRSTAPRTRCRPATTAASAAARAARPSPTTRSTRPCA